MTAPLRPLSPRRPGQPSAAQRPAPQQPMAQQGGASPYLRPPTTFAGMAQRGMPRPPRPQMASPMMQQPMQQPPRPTMAPNSAQNPTVPRTFAPSATPYQGQQDHAISQWLANPSAYNSNVVQGTYGVLDRQITNAGRTAARGIDNTMAARGLRVSTPARTQHGDLAVELDRNRRDAAQTLIDAQARDYASARAGAVDAAQRGTQQSFDRDATTFGVNEAAINDAFARGLAGRQQGAAERRLDLDTELGRGDLSLRRTLGVGALDMDWARLASGESQFGATLAENQRAYNMGDHREGQRIGIARDAADSNFYQNAASLFATALGNPQLAAALRETGARRDPSDPPVFPGGQGTPSDPAGNRGGDGTPGSALAPGGTPSFARQVGSYMTRASAPGVGNFGNPGGAGNIGNGPAPGVPPLAPPGGYPSYNGNGTLYGGQQPPQAPGGQPGGQQPYFAGWGGAATRIPQYAAPVQGGSAQPYVSPLQGWVPSWRQEGAGGAPGAPGAPGSPAGGPGGVGGTPGLPGGPIATQPNAGGQPYRFGEPWAPSRPSGPLDVAPAHRPGAPNLWTPPDTPDTQGPNPEVAAWLRSLEEEYAITPEDPRLGDVVTDVPEFVDNRVPGSEEAFDRRHELLRAGWEFVPGMGFVPAAQITAAMRAEMPRLVGGADGIVYAHYPDGRVVPAQR